MFCTTEEQTGGRGVSARAMPRQLAFVQGDSDASTPGTGQRRLVAWGLRFNDGSAVSVTTVADRPSVALWRSVEDAETALDAEVGPADVAPADSVPLLLVFYQDLWDDDGTAVGWRPIAWGLQLHDGSGISLSIEGCPSVTLWLSVKDATKALDAQVDTVEPRPELASDDGSQTRRSPASPTAPAGTPGPSRP